MRFTLKYFHTKCDVCGESFDMRDLTEVAQHLHGRKYRAAKRSDPAKVTRIKYGKAKSVVQR